MKNKIALSIILATISLQSNAEYIVKYKIDEPTSIIIVDWTNTSASYTSWESIGEIYGCSNWTPDESTIVVGQPFNQERICNINQERFRQDREVSSKGTYKDIGDPQLETRFETVNQNRNNTGIMESWVSIGSLYGEWINNGPLYDCTNWTPATSTVNAGVQFQQEANDCKQNQNRTKQDREQETTTLAIRNIGLETNETQVLLNQYNIRDSIGTKSTKECLYNATSNYNYWVTNSSATTAHFFINGYNSIPYMWINVNTGMADYFSGTQSPVAGLTKISNTEFRYIANDKTWKITRGDFVEYGYAGNYQYRICFE